MTTIHKATGAGDFLTAVPAMLGYRPTESVVAVPFAGTRTIGAMRFDVPAAENAGSFAAVAMGLLVKVENATGFALIVYGEREQAEAIGSAMTTQADMCGMQVIDRLYVAGDAWGRIGEDGTEALPETPAHLAAMLTASDQRAGAALPAVDEALAAQVAEALPTDLPVALAMAGGDLLDAIEQALSWDGSDLDAGAVALLAAMLNRPATRDIALVQWAHGFAAGESARDAQIGWEQGEEYPAHLARVMWGEGPRPDPKRLDAALTACRYVAALSPEEAQVGPLAAAAWLSWALGRSTRADAYARRALAIDSEHGLSQIVRTFVDAGHLPEFAFSR
ncbi:MAG: DUF4192 family protein [Microbacterium sp.]|uniref:DUF4192 family protein n=1 Tax=Microbacterium sp. TaxID=51671 RepID=UPI0027215D5E|nr:DUF4192 family protein [Microbacterium sp.]MDO8383881.1 DUF4192 family protein [Microbacterium sp.]